VFFDGHNYGVFLIWSFSSSNVMSLSVVLGSAAAATKVLVLVIYMAMA
jgi:hypothetical protein